MRAVGSAKFSAITRRAFGNPCAGEPAKALKVRLRRLPFASPELSGEDPHKWRGLIATAGLSGRASEESRNKLVAELGELLICAPRDLAGLEADQLHIVSDNAESNRLLGQLWRAAEASGDIGDFRERANPPTFA